MVGTIGFMSNVFEEMGPNSKQLFYQLQLLGEGILLSYIKIIAQHKLRGILVPTNFATDWLYNQELYH